MIRQWLCCVVIRNVGLWLIFVAIIRTYTYQHTKYGNIQNTERRKREDDVIITRYASHTHIRTYICVYICRLCHFFQSWASPSENRERSLAIDAADFIDCRILNLLSSDSSLVSKEIASNREEGNKGTSLQWQNQIISVRANWRFLNYFISELSTTTSVKIFFTILGFSVAQA